MPFDVSEQTLRDAAAAVNRDYPAVDVHAVVGDFEHHLGVDPRRRPPARRVPRRHDRQPRCRRARAEFLREVADGLGPDDYLLLGLDLVKDIDRLEAAYDDSQGVTAEFNKNVLAVMNRELDADFDVDRFEHVAVFEKDHGVDRDAAARRSTRTRCTCARSSSTVPFAAGEEMRTEVSAKFTREQVVDELDAAGLQLVAVVDRPRRRLRAVAARPERRRGAAD